MFTFTPTILKNLVNKPATRKYPFVKRAPFENYRGELYNNIDDCIFCGTCARKCPSVCITVDKKTGLWECDPFACVYCGICVDTCPTKCLHFHDVHRGPATQPQMLTMQGEPPKPKKKKAAAAKEAAPAKEAAAKDTAEKSEKPAKKKADSTKEDKADK
ncbi:4Fe-4S binding protein [Pseudodesulfovibrio senegalensis]|uniref:4Fe-4S ferredoxin n=1 Tax=Pseudodesulfovibrio senegalensis TaxID=1721087 RepID=A0A6N6N432_9BACT|nr:4Fe-4S binding protein [Pseudodesulfovibrio senegalensis]KAB1442942.1 4Fe-4S ferredoxin [Pseudodesulfovibrio senegalensis]